MDEEIKVTPGQQGMGKINAPAGVLMFGTADTPEADIRAALEARFRYQQWTPEKTERGKAVTDACIATAHAIICNVPPCPTRTRVINDIEKIRMMANAAITHDGKF